MSRGTLHGAFVGIDGSASNKADRALLARCHRLVRMIATLILEAGGGLVLAVGREPRAVSDAPETSLVFTWTVVEAICAFLDRTVSGDGRVDRPVVRVVYSPKTVAERIPPERQALWRILQERGAIVSAVLEDDDHVGEKIRPAQIAHSNASVLIAGGKGVKALAYGVLEKGGPVIPLNPSVGASLDDGEGAVTLHRHALAEPHLFAAGCPAELQGLLASLDFAEDGIEHTARRVVNVLAKAVAGARQPLQRGVDIAVLTVIPPELKAARVALGIAEDAMHKTANGTNYWQGTVPSRSARRDYQVALTCIGNPGNYESTRAAADALHDVAPRVIALMGIAAGVRGKVKIGDVVVADRVFAYEPGAVTQDEQGAHFAPRPEVGRTTHAMEQDVTAYLSQEYERRIDTGFAQRGGVYPTAKRGQVREFRADVATKMSVRTATIASGEKLLRDPSKLRWMREQHGKTEAAEMEAMGLYTACRKTNASWLVVRGISDFGDEFKDDRFHTFASAAAATVLADFLANALFVDHTKPTGER